MHTSPYNGTVASEDTWAHENKVSICMFPLAHYMSAKNVYVLGFDNSGFGIDRHIEVHGHGQLTTVLQKMKCWVDWKKYHNMNIYSVVEDEHSPNNSVLPYKNFKELLK